jgi:hypothetical protein
MQSHCSMSTYAEHRLCMLVVHQQLQPLQHRHAHGRHCRIKRKLACSSTRGTMQAPGSQCITKAADKGQGSRGTVLLPHKE